MIGDNNARVLLTGSTGFIGEQRTPALLKSGYEVHTMERYVTGRYSLAQSRDMIKHYANFTDYPAVRLAVKEIRPDYVVHLGAISAVSFSYDHYVEVNEVNYIGTVNLAEACRREVPSFKQFIFAGTSEEYGMALKDDKDPLRENSELMPNSPYAVAKVASDYYLRYMYMAYQFPYTILRPFNTYGRKDNAHFFIERTITQMIDGGEVSLGDPNAMRDWLYVDDHVTGYMKALGNEKAIGETIQLCTGKCYTTEKTAELIAKATGFKGDIHWHSSQPRPLDAKVLVGDNSKARELLSWTPQYSLEDGLKETVKYWKSKRVKHSK